MLVLVTALLMIWAPRTVHSHGALVQPPSRNAFDRMLPAFQAGRTSACNCGNPATGCNVSSRQPMNGQSCFWFSQGCFIGCANCTGTDIQPDGLEPQTDGPHASCTLSNRPAGATYMPTLPKRLWTMNRAAVELSVNDTYRFHPWRAPGSAPVEVNCILLASFWISQLRSRLTDLIVLQDACGIAGGTTRKYAGPGHTTFMPVSTNQSSAVQGSRGSQVLAASAAGATWKIGATAEVKFGIRYNHGGGYQAPTQH